MSGGGGVEGEVMLVELVDSISPGVRQTLPLLNVPSAPHKRSELDIHGHSTSHQRFMKSKAPCDTHVQQI